MAWQKKKSLKGVMNSQWETERKYSFFKLIVENTSAFFFFLNESFFLFGCVGSSVQGLSLVAASGGRSSSWCAGLSLSRPLLLRSTSSRCAGSVVVAHGPSCSTAFGIFPDQGLNPCARPWQADSQPLRHQGTLFFGIVTLIFIYQFPPSFPFN